MSMPALHAMMARAYQLAGKIDKALLSVAEGLNASSRNHEAYYDAELHRLRGDLLTKTKRHSERRDFEKAEACYKCSLDIARRQKARSLELRSTMSLTRLWQRTGKKNEARKLLVRIYSWFTEGFETGRS